MKSISKLLGTAMLLTTAIAAAAQAADQPGVKAGQFFTAKFSCPVLNRHGK